MLRSVSDPPKPMTEPPPEVDPGRYDGPARAAPYPLQRTAPAYDLVDMAAQIQRADETLVVVTEGKLGLIAAQIERLRAEAHALLDKARRDAELHRARCNFEKRAGGVYHLYRKNDGELWFSRLAPEEWVTPQPQSFEGTFRLELDMSFTRVDLPPEEPATRVAERALGRGPSR
jgi:hypothetical protein